jgi:8-oxo-dGTP diphosphatase
MSQEPKVGTATIITRDNKVLLMKRRGPHGTGTWSTPGGHLDFGESPEQCAAREAKEEVGVEVLNLQFRAVTNDLYSKTAAGITSRSGWKPDPSGEPAIIAEKEVEEIGWFPWDCPAEPLFLPLENYVNKKNYLPKYADSMRDCFAHSLSLGARNPGDIAPFASEVKQPGQ